MVTRPIGVITRLVSTPLAAIRLVQQVEASGGSKVQLLPRTTVLLVGQRTLSWALTVTVKLQLLVLPLQSVATQLTVVVVPGAK